ERDGGSERHRAARDVETRTHGISLLLDAVALALQARAPGLLERVLGRGVLGLRGLLGLCFRLLLGLLLRRGSRRHAAGRHHRRIRRWRPWPPRGPRLSRRLPWGLPLPPRPSGP